MGEKHHHSSSGVDDARIMIGQALNDLTSMAHSEFKSWQQPILVEHASDTMK